ncbi:MAG TPA: hypothetical protein RMH99_01515 [Sandaracinaceae bacterium LLY-WYZ-13_1]|nr:hypothetical protein [Sandaracinaceae bacterium LLY-WYZ-13_1]
MGAGAAGEAGELEAKTLFETLQEKHPGRYQDGQLRTLQRRVKQWRAEQGPDKEVFFPQEHRPGEAAQLDFTHASSLGVTIMGVAFAHLLCHVVLPYSNWQHVTVCLSESFLALKRGLQAALFRLGRVPKWLQTDNSTAATHELATGKRGFNEEYAELVEHFGMKARTIGIGKSGSAAVSSIASTTVHVIWSLVQKPGAFVRYRYREELFPTTTFRRAYDALSGNGQSRESDLEYLRVLHLAAATIEEDVEAALAAEEPITCDAVRARLSMEADVAVPELAPYEPALGGYDELLEEVAR